MIQLWGKMKKMPAVWRNILTPLVENVFWFSLSFSITNTHTYTTINKEINTRNAEKYGLWRTKHNKGRQTWQWYLIVSYLYQQLLKKNKVVPETCCAQSSCVYLTEKSSLLSRDWNSDRPAELCVNDWMIYWHDIDCCNNPHLHVRFWVDLR